MRNPLDTPSELTKLREWCMSIIEFFQDINPQPIYPQFYSDILVQIAQADKAANSRALRAISAELNRMANALPRASRLKLEELLFARFGRGLIHDRRNLLKIVKNVTSNNIIDNEDDYYAVRSYVDEIECEKGKSELTKHLIALLTRFELTVPTSSKDRELDPQATVKLRE